MWIVPCKSVKKKIYFFSSVLLRISLTDKWLLGKTSGGQDPAILATWYLLHLSLPVSPFSQYKCLYVWINTGFDSKTPP